MQLKILNEIPSELYELDITKVHELFGGPTLIHVMGKKDNALFLSTLLHGNETTSFYVLQRLINKYRDSGFPRDILIFIGNTLAASEGIRHLPGQPDFNRIWEEGDTEENQLAKEVMDYAKEQNLFASIDVHNNTGKNPFYGCINSLEPQFLELASHFGNHTVFFTEPHNVQSMAFAGLCTSTTIEAGLPGEPAGIDAAFNFVDTILNLDQLTMNPTRNTSEVYHTIARMMVHPEASIDFEFSSNSKSDLSFTPDIDSKNFEIVPKNTHLAYAKDLKHIRVEDNKGEDITSDFLFIEEGKLRTNRIFIPAMFTKDIYVMKEDCLGYVMEIMIPTR